MKDKGDARSVHLMEQLFSSHCSAGSNPLLGEKKQESKLELERKSKKQSNVKHLLSSIQSTCKKTYNETEQNRNMRKGKNKKRSYHVVFNECV
jgi:hypothetical protein